MRPAIRKKTVIFLGGLLLILGIVVLTVPRLIDLNHYNAPIVAAIEKALGGKAQLGRITWGLHTGLWLEADEFSISAATGVLGNGKLKRVRADVSLLSLLSGKIVIRNFHMDAPEVSLNLAATEEGGGDDPGRHVPSDRRNAFNTSSNTPGQSAKPAAEEMAPSPSARSAPRSREPLKVLITGVTIEQGRVTLNDALTLPSQTTLRTFTDVTVKADHNKTDRTVTFDLSLRDETKDGFGSLAANGMFSGLTENFTIENPQLAVKATIKDQSVAAIIPYLKNDRLAELLGGSVSFELDYTGDFSPTGQASGSFDLTHLTYADQSMWEAPIPGAPTELIYAATLTPDELVVDNVSFTVGKINVDGRSRLENWKTAPVFKGMAVSGNIPLAELTPLLPWKKMGDHLVFLKKILEGGGELRIENASLTELDPAKLSAGWTHLWPQIELDAKITALSVQPTQTMPKLPKASNVSAAIRLTDGAIDIDHLTADISAISLPEISAQITQLPHQPQIDVKLQGPAKVADLADESLQKLLIGFGFDKLAVSGDLDLVVHLATAQPESFGIEGTATLNDGVVKTVYSPVVIQGLSADVTLASDTASVTNLGAVVILPANKWSPENTVNLSLQGQVTDWNRRPSLSLKNLKTSPVSLAALATVIPWEQFANAPKIVKDVLHDGGTIEVNHLSLPAIDLTEPFNEPDKLLATAKGSLSLAGVTVRPVLSLPAIEGLSGHPSLEKGVLTATDLKARIGPLTTPTMTIQVTHLPDRPKYKVAAKGPVHVVGTADESVEKILQKYGLKKLSGKAEVDVDLSYDSAAPDQWSANGSAILEGIQAVSHPGDVKLNNLRGRVSLVKQKSYECILDNLSANIDGAPIQLTGKLSGTGGDDLTIGLKANAHQLDLSAVSELVPGLKEMALGGKIDLDMDIYLPQDKPSDSRLTGTLKTNQLKLHAKEADLGIENAVSDIEFSGRTATINHLALHLNEQQINAFGQLSRPEEPALDLVITSPDLNIDRLLPAKDAHENPPKPRKANPSGEMAKKPIEEKVAESEKPRFLHLSSANVRLEAQKGRFRGQDVEDLRITADYEKGVIENYAVDFKTGGGHAAARGMVDVSHLDHVTFTVDPEIKTVPLKTVVSLLDLDEISVEGPLSASGQLKARTGSTRELFASLEGSLNAEMGRGRIRVRDYFGKALVEMLRFMRVRNRLSGNLIGRLEGDGLSFNSAKASTTLKGGRIKINSIEYDGDAFSIDADGSIDLPGHQLNVVTKLAVFKTVGKAMKVVPIIGEAADAVSSLYFVVDGSLDNPKVRLAPAEGVIRGVEGTMSAPRRILNDDIKLKRE